MKNLLILFSAGILFAGCGGEKSEYENVYDQDREIAVDTAASNTTASAQGNTNADAAAVPGSEFAQGNKLIAMSDCLSCHREDEKLIGPAYVAVAEKYEFNDKNVDYLAGKIITGGQGVWGEIPMTPHPDLSKEEAGEMAKYILSLREGN